MNEQQERMSAAASFGFAAIAYITTPEVWPGFAAFAERTIGMAWTERDRLAARADARLLWQLSEELEKL